MTYEVYRYIFIVAAILSIALLITSVVLFIVLKIPKIVSDLTGMTEKKAIKSLREQSERNCDESQPVAGGRRHGKITDKIATAAPVYVDNNEEVSETTVLYSSDETSVLDSNINETTVLGVADTYGNFIIEYEITYIHTDEIIGAEVF